MIYLNDNILVKNQDLGLTLTILGCSENSTKSNFEIFFSKNYDFLKENITLLNKDLEDYINKKDFYGSSLFILSSFGNYEFNWKNSLQDWEKFSLLVEKIGGTDFMAYLLRENLIIENGRTIDFGHPYLLIGSPKFGKFEGFEYKFHNNEKNLIGKSHKNDLHAEIWVDLNKENLKCPKKILNYKKIEEMEEIYKNKLEEKLDLVKNETKVNNLTKKNNNNTVPLKNIVKKKKRRRKSSCYWRNF